MFNIYKQNHPFCSQMDWSSFSNSMLTQRPLPTCVPEFDMKEGEPLTHSGIDLAMKELVFFPFTLVPGEWTWTKAKDCPIGLVPLNNCNVGQRLWKYFVLDWMSFVVQVSVNTTLEPRLGIKCPVYMYTTLYSKWLDLNILTSTSSWLINMHNIIKTTILMHWDIFPDTKLIYNSSDIKLRK